MAGKDGTGSEAIFAIEDLHVSVEGKEIVKGLNLVIRKGEVHALMGPNGSGKSTLAHALMGHPRYEVTEGRAIFKGEDILGMTPDKRARRGLFLAFQYPAGIPGVVMGNFLRSALKARRGEDVPVREFRKVLDETLDLLKMDPAFARRYVNEGFSGGEKKRAEVLQMAMLEPEMAILDETDSGLDIDALKTVAEGINALRGPERAMLSSPTTSASSTTCGRTSSTCSTTGASSRRAARSWLTSWRSRATSGLPRSSRRQRLAPRRDRNGYEAEGSSHRRKL